MTRACGSEMPDKKTFGAPPPSEKTEIQCVDTPNSLNVVFASSPKSMSAAIQVCRDYLKSKMLSEDTKYHIVLRELFLNAIQHGNQMATEKKVNVRLEWIPNYEVRIRVEDAGPGFDYRSINMQPPENPARMKQRGFVLIRALCDEIEFNEKGNCIVVRIRL